MELHDLKNRAQKRGVPGRQFRATPANPEAWTDFISTLKAVDQRDRARLRRGMLFAAGAGVFYVLVFALTWFAPPHDSPEFHRFLLSMFGLLFLSAALVSRRRSNELGRIDYAQPMASFLKGVERRYRALNVRDTALGLVFFVAFSLTGALGWLSAKDRYFPSMDDGTALNLFGGILAVALVLGLVAGVNEWRKRKAPLLRQVREMMADLEAGTGSQSRQPSQSQR